MGLGRGGMGGSGRSMDTTNEFDGGGGGMDIRHVAQNQFLDQQSVIPYLPYAQQGPYQAIMNQMGGFGGAAGTGYQQGMGALYGGGAGGGYDPNLYKRAPVAAPLAPSVVNSANRGNSNTGNFGRDRGLNPTVPNFVLNYDSNSYTGGLLPSLLGQQPPAPVVDTTGYNSAAQAESAQLQSLANQYGQYNNPSASSGNGAPSVSDRTLSEHISGQDAANSRDLATGGHIQPGMLLGPNPAGPDDGYHSLKTGEYVINDKAVKKYGIELMDAINSGKISKGKLRGLLEM